MATANLQQHIQSLSLCRFCPMCKPAAEVANLTLFESHSTRARAMALWRIASGVMAWTPRDAELLYQSTLDSISQAWCVSHQPVSDYVAAARADVFASGLAPEDVLQALRNLDGDVPAVPDGPTIMLAGEGAGAAGAALAALRGADTPLRLWAAPSGALAYTLGDWEAARQQAAAVVTRLRAGHVTRVVADGPQTYWMLTRVYPALGVELPGDTTVELLSAALDAREVELEGVRGRRVFFHDCRAATLVADALPTNEAVLPGFHGADVQNGSCGAGDVFDRPRRILRRSGALLVETQWTRALAKSCGADDGLAETYPALAERLAAQRLAEAQHVGADLIVTDSPRCAAWLARVSGAWGLPVRLLAEVVR